MTRRYRYMIYGLVVESELHLASVEEATDQDGEAAIELALGSPEFLRTAAPTVVDDPDDWLQHAVLADGRVYIKLGNIFETVISADGRKVICAAPGDVDRRSFEASLMNYVLSAALTVQGEEPLHSTVVEFDGRAVGLLGRSGAGKSTLAAFLISKGADLLTDDMLRLQFVGGSVLAYPGPYRLKLLAEPGRRFLAEATMQGHFNPLSDKIMVQPRANVPVRRGARPVLALFDLDNPDEAPSSGNVSVSRLTGARLARSILASAMELRYAPPDRMARQVRFAARVAEALPVYQLLYPRSFGVMDRVAEEIFRLARP